jgi:hypothetical protein
MDWLEIGKLVGSAIGGGAVGSLVTQWSGWGVEKLKLRRQARVQMIADWRKLIATAPDNGGWSSADPDCRKFLKSEHFASLEPHLPRDLLDRLRRHNTIFVSPDFPRRQLSERVAQLEQQWGLI